MSLTIVSDDQKTEKTKETGILNDAPKNMSKFAAYLKEREGVELIETERGFSIYVITGEECYIRDVFVYPEYRKQGAGSDICDTISAIARESGCKIITTSVSPLANNPTLSMDAILRYGMKLNCVLNGLIFFSKDL